MARAILYVVLVLSAVACRGSHQADGQPVADPGDAVALQRAILDARATHDQYVLTGEDEAAQQFEQAFADSLRHCDPSLAQQIFGHSPEM